jgi:hypothetical protein
MIASQAMQKLPALHEVSNLHAEEEQWPNSKCNKYADVVNDLRQAREKFANSRAQSLKSLDRHSGGFEWQSPLSVQRQRSEMFAGNCKYEHFIDDEATQKFCATLGTVLGLSLLESLHAAQRGGSHDVVDSHGHDHILGVQMPNSARVKTSEFTIMLDKSAGEQLGVDLAAAENPLRIMRVDPVGLVQKWNESHRDRKVEEGHRIVEVNGIRCHTQGMLNELRKNSLLFIKVDSNRMESGPPLARI